MPRKKVEKLSFKELVGGPQKSNADLYKDDPKRRVNHVRHRTARNRLTTFTGGEYKRPLAGDIKKDMKLHELAREFVNNGMRKTNAVSAVFGVPLKQAKTDKYMSIFDSSHFRQMVSQMLQGVDGEFAEPPKEFAIQRAMSVLMMNILDYVGSDGRWLTVDELKALPRDMQLLLDDFKMKNVIRPVALTDQNGKVVKDDNDEPYMVEVREQWVDIKLPDKTKQLELLAKFMHWIETHGDTNIVIGADLMMAAEQRMKELHRDAKTVEGSSERLSAD